MRGRINWGCLIGALFGFIGVMLWTTPATSAWVGGTVVLGSGTVGGIMWIFLWAIL